jgi:hypothetical protein
MTLSRIINRTSYYLSDTPLLCRTLFTYFRAYFFTPDNELTAFANPRTHRESRDIDKVRNCVGLCFLLGMKAGLKNTCLIHSVVLCRILNQHGFNASVVFAAKKNEENKMIGHCWVAVNNAEITDDWHVIFNYP